MLQSVRRLLQQDLVSGFLQEALPVDLGDVLGLRERIFLDFARFQHENGAAEVAIRLLSDVDGELGGQLEILLLANGLKWKEVSTKIGSTGSPTYAQNLDDFVDRRRSHSNAEATGLDSRNDPRGGVDA